MHTKARESVWRERERECIYSLSFSFSFSFSLSLSLYLHTCTYTRFNIEDSEGHFEEVGNLNGEVVVVHDNQRHARGRVSPVMHIYMHMCLNDNMTPRDNLESSRPWCHPGEVESTNARLGRNAHKRGLSRSSNIKNNRTTQDLVPL